jgi:tetratricopeptide (TPR) repeat protein
MRRFTLLLLFICSLPVYAQPKDDYNSDWLKEPYQLLIVVHAEPHPLLTNVFVEQFTRDLGDSLQRDLGRTAKVSTLIYRESGSGRTGTDGPKEMMETVITRGWTELDSLPKQINPTKVHLIRLFYVDGEYEVQSRQVDGDTSTVSVLRKSRTTDRQWITRLAALQVALDFGQVGEVTEVNGQTLKIRMRAHGLGVPETIRLVQGETMALCKVRRTATGYTSTKLDETIAFITNVDAVKGEVTARLYTRFENILAKDRQTVAFRAIKLGTRVSPLQLKLVDQDGNPIGGYSVSHFPSGYENGGAETIGTTDTQGRVVSKDPIYHVGFVRVLIAGVGKLDTPIPLIDDQPVIVKISGNREAAILDETKFEYDRWMKAYKVIAENFAVDYKLLYSDLVRDGKEKEAIANLDKIAKKIKEDSDDLAKEFDRVKKAASSGQSKDANKLVEHASSVLKELQASSKRMEEQVALELNPTEDRIFLKQAIAAEQDLDYDKAIEFYKRSLGKKRDQPKVEAKLRSLERVWKTQYNDKEHKEAREYILKVWANKAKPLTWEQVEKEITKAEQMFDDISKRGDYLTVFVLLRGNLKNLITLNSAREALGNSEEVQEKQGIIEKVRKLLIDFNKRADDFAQKAYNDDIKGG